MVASDPATQPSDQTGGPRRLAPDDHLVVLERLVLRFFRLLREIDDRVVLARPVLGRLLLAREVVVLVLVLVLVVVFVFVLRLLRLLGEVDDRVVLGRLVLR